MKKSERSDRVADKIDELLEIIPKTTRTVWRHDEETKATALALRAAGMSYEKISNSLNVAIASVHGWVNNVGESEIETVELAEKVKRSLASKTYNLANHVLSAINDDDVEKASLLQKGTFSAVMIDKARLMEGQSTQNIAQVQKRLGSVDSDMSDLSSEMRDDEAEIAHLEAQLAEVDD